jgi:hypothetical protein
MRSGITTKNSSMTSQQLQIKPRHSIEPGSSEMTHGIPPGVAYMDSKEKKYNIIIFTANLEER